MNELIIYISLIGKCTKVYLYNSDDGGNILDKKSVFDIYLFESNKSIYLSIHNSESII